MSCTVKTPVAVMSMGLDVLLQKGGGFIYKRCVIPKVLTRI